VFDKEMFKKYFFLAWGNCSVFMPCCKAHVLSIVTAQLSEQALSHPHHQNHSEAVTRFIAIYYCFKGYSHLEGKACTQGEKSCWKLKMKK